MKTYGAFVGEVFSCVSECVIHYLGHTMGGNAYAIVDLTVDSHPHCPFLMLSAASRLS